MHNLRVANGQNHAARVGGRWPAQDNVLPRRAVGQSARSEDGVEHRLSALERKRARRIDLAEDIVNFADARDQTHVDRPRVLGLGFHRGTDNSLNLRSRPARDDHLAINAEVNRSVLQDRLIGRQPHRRVEIGGLNQQGIARLDIVRRKIALFQLPGQRLRFCCRLL